jgi:HEAT repeat protein
LIPLLKDADPLVRRLAAYALGQIGPKAKAAIPALKELLNDTERDVVTATINAIRAIDETAAGNIAAPPNVSN